MRCPVGEPTLRDLILPIVRDVIAEQTSTSVPLMISQRNSESALGIPSRLHLEYCRRPDFTPKVTKHGQLRLVDAVEYRTWLRHVTRIAPSNDLTGAEAVLAELGLTPRRPTPPRRSRKDL